MEILHVTAECYPVAKAGGLGDVAGALPKYQVQLGHIAKLVMPMYRTKFLFQNEFDVVHKGAFNMGPMWFNYTIIKEQTSKLGFDLYLVDINGLLDREQVYGYNDDAERFTAFQIAVVDWVAKWEHKPDVVHVHDYHAGLVPFMMQNCYAYRHLAAIPTVLTIHNAQYQGWMGWDKSSYLPAYDSWQWGKLDWKDSINPLASAVKCAHRVTTVSYSYLEEMRQEANGLEKLFQYEQGKCTGILNGIDDKVWDPAVDTYIDTNYSLKDIDKGKLASKKVLCDGKMCFLVLGSGDPQVEWELSNLNMPLAGYYNSKIGYNEKLSHQMYAGADFLLMPSRVEPCGLNQMYAMRYGTIPIVRNTGGLKDTVVDIGETGGYGIKFNDAKVWDITYSIHRAMELYADKPKIKGIKKKLMQIDNSWETSAQHYIDLYQSLQ